jgi:hypothetical protein
MKTFKALTLVAFALSCAASLHAQTKVYITGSTAFRANAHTGIKNIYDPSPAVQYGYIGTSFGGANQAIFQGNIGGNPVNIYTSWSGSEAGIQTVADATQNVNFLPDGTPVSSGGTSGATAGTDPHHPDVAFSDTFQSTSQFNGIFRGVTYATLTESPGTSAGHGSPVGIVVFKWCASNGATFTNITSQQARGLYASGKFPLALFTGNNADETKPVVALGRNPDSGTRLTTFAESGVGALSTVKQYQPQDSTSTIVKATTGTISKFVAWPAETINGVPISTFNSGYSSGGDLAKAMRAVTTDPVNIAATSYAAANVTRVAYLGSGDADSNLLNSGSPSPGVELSYNGVFLGIPGAGQTYNDLTALTEGKYTFWGYEHVLYNGSTIVLAVQNVADALATQLHDVDSPVLLSNMKVTRTTDGSRVTFNYAAP